MTVELFNFSIDLMRVLLWQYNDATNLQSLIERKQAWIDIEHRDFWNNWYSDVFNLATANDFGLQVWAIILGVHFDLEGAIPPAWLGFDASGGDNLDNSGFYPENGAILSTEEKRLVLQLRYRQITTNATTDELYRSIQGLLTGAKVLDGLDMSIIVTYPTFPTIKQLRILDNFDVLPRPNSVKIIRRFGYSAWFGFNGQNFDNGIFGA